MAGLEAYVKPQTAEAIASGADFDFPDPKEPLTVLVPTSVAAYCYLHEALLWVALQRYPLYSQWDDSGDVRLDTEDMEDIVPRIDFEPLSDDECDRAGLPRDPEYAAWDEGRIPPLSPESIKKILALVPDDNEKQQELLDQLPTAEAHASAVSAVSLAARGEDSGVWQAYSQTSCGVVSRAAISRRMARLDARAVASDSPKSLAFERHSLGRV